MTAFGTTTSEYGPDAVLYEMNRAAFRNGTLCNSQGYCPNGLMDMSSCFYGKLIFRLFTRDSIFQASIVDRLVLASFFKNLFFYVPKLNFNLTFVSTRCKYSNDYKAIQ